ncbi:MAG: YARHG domain-containing protein [Bacteroidetes bacterium]|nr:MAG: YARHG domain-containing protein [Bacteroidota bacterium]
MRVFFVIIAMISIVVSSCDNKSNGKKIKKVKVEKSKPEDQSPREPVTFSRPGVNLPNSALADFQRASRKHKHLPFLCITQDGNLFVSANKKFDLYSLHDSKVLKTLKFGLVGSDGDTLLPTEYSKIGNPGQIAYGYVEVKDTKGYRLFDYLNKRFVGSTYDQIFPSQIMGYLAIGKKGDLYEKLYDDGTVKKINEEDFPGYRSLLPNLKIDVQSEDFGLWINTELFNDEYKEENYAGLYVSPSFLYSLGVVPQFVTGVMLKDSSLGIEELKANKVLAKTTKKNNTALLYSFYERGVDGRGWMTEEQYLVSIDQKNKVKKKVKLNEFSDYSLQNKCSECGENTFSFIGDSIAEIEYWIFNDNEYAKKGMDSLFVAMTMYNYFKINDNGSITPLYAGCLFPMASVKKLSEKDLKGCFLKNDQHINNITKFPVSPNFSDWEDDGYDGWVVEYNQLTANDIRYVINEIYARHGYIFSDPKINSHFRSLSWYKPVSKNVDHLLTPIEKQNIYFLQNVEKTLRSTKESELKPQRRVLVWAG